MERGSIIDGRIELEEQQALEIERCRDFRYFYENYWSVKDKYGNIIKHTLFRKEVFNIIKQKLNFNFTK